MQSCATIKSTRKDYPLYNIEVKNRGDNNYSSSNTGITSYKWKDTKEVKFTSNYNVVEETFVHRKDKHGKNKSNLVLQLFCITISTWGC